MKTPKYYTVFSDKDDSVVTAGTAEQCAKALNMTLGSFHSMVSNIRSGKRYKLYSIVVEDAESQRDQ